MRTRTKVIVALGIIATTGAIFGGVKCYENYYGGFGRYGDMAYNKNGVSMYQFVHNYGGDPYVEEHTIRAFEGLSVYYAFVGTDVCDSDYPPACETKSPSYFGCPHFEERERFCDENLRGKASEHIKYTLALANDTFGTDKEAELRRELQAAVNHDMELICRAIKVNRIKENRRDKKANYTVRTSRAERKATGSETRPMLGWEKRTNAAIIDWSWIEIDAILWLNAYKHREYVNGHTTITVKSVTNSFANILTLDTQEILRLKEEYVTKAMLSYRHGEHVDRISKIRDILDYADSHR